MLARSAFVDTFKAGAEGGAADLAANGLEAIEEMASILARAGALADIRARAAILRRMESRRLSELAQRQGRLSELAQRQEPRFFTQPFEEAIAEVVELTPLSAETALEVTAAYGRREFTLRQGIALDVVERVREKIASMLREGAIVRDFQQVAREFGAGFTSDAYAETVFRTEVTRAQSAGRLRQASSPELRDFVVAFQYHAVGDARTRPNHLAIDGKQFATNHPAWASLTPPLGFNCRCRIFMVTRPDARRSGRLDEAGAFRSDSFPVPGGEPDKGFEVSPSLEIYGL